MKNIDNFTQWKKWISRCDVLARDHAPKAPRAVWAQSKRITRSAVDTFNTLRIILKSQSENKKLSWSVWIVICSILPLGPLQSYTYPAI